MYGEKSDHVRGYPLDSLLHPGYPRPVLCRFLGEGRLGQVTPMLGDMPPGGDLASMRYLVQQPSPGASPTLCHVQ